MRFLGEYFEFEPYFNEMILQLTQPDFPTNLWNIRVRSLAMQSLRYFSDLNSNIARAQLVLAARHSRM